MIKKVHYEHNFVYPFLNYKSIGMNNILHFVTVFKYEVIIYIQCSLKTALCPVFISEISDFFFH
jgi:hypothetical protein